jgi:L-alanine-DL-glutamate epimerase-like enolase superfamily enzyme
MKHNFVRTFDKVKIPQERQEQIRDALSSRISEIESEDKSMNTKSVAYRKPKAALVAAVIALSCILLAGFAYAYGTQIIELLGGGRIESVESSSGGSVSISIVESYPYEVREGRVYFMLDGSGKDITSYCSEDTYYQYERINENGYRHVLLIGGTPDNHGWTEIIFDVNGNLVGATGIGSAYTEWENRGREQLGLAPWGGIGADE